MILLSVDPGLRACGCALWRDGELVAADWVEAPTQEKESAGIVRAMAEEVQSWSTRVDTWSRAPYTVAERVDQLVVECPQTYGGRAAAGDANVLIDLACVVGAVQLAFCVPTRYVRPHEWKGTIPKRNAEGVNVVRERAAAAIGAAGVARMRRKNHNVWDAVGIGLWWIKSSAELVYQ